ncbi:hypothetical protein KR038_007366 [Drosophila bunnanda]|nr:hypothetical protein KR038_007366 [Drosophila bunnanda]
MFVCKRKLQAALQLQLLLLLSLCLGFALTQNSSQELATGRSENLFNLSSSVAAKSFEPPPEFYRGPGSSANNQHSLGSVGESLSETYNKWKVLGNSQGSLQERISVGHHQGGAGAIASHAPPVGSFETNSHPYPYEYSHSSGGAGPGLAAAGASGAYFGSSSVEAGIPFDVYGSRPSHGFGQSHYSTSEYGYPYHLDHHEVATLKGPGHGEGSSKALLAKSFLIPLASAAVLGIAAALISNPLLLQLGTVSGLGTPFVGKRKRRAAGSRHRRNLVTS